MRCRLFFVVSGALGACTHKILMQQKKEGENAPRFLIAFGDLIAPLRQQKRKGSPNGEPILDSAPTTAEKKARRMASLFAKYYFIGTNANTYA